VRRHAAGRSDLLVTSLALACLLAWDCQRLGSGSHPLVRYGGWLRMAGCVAHPQPAARWRSPVRLGRVGSAGRGRLPSAIAWPEAHRALALDRGDAVPASCWFPRSSGLQRRVAPGISPSLAASPATFRTGKSVYRMAGRGIAFRRATPSLHSAFFGYLLPVAGASAPTGRLLPRHRVAGG
jgi:hypothetical protein